MRSSWSAASGATKRPLPKSSPSPNRCPVRQAARLASRLGCCARDGRAAPPHGLGSPCHRRLLMLGFAFGHLFLTGRLGLGIVHGLQLVAVAVVAQAILSMRKSLAPDAARMAAGAGGGGHRLVSLQPGRAPCWRSPPERCWADCCRGLRNGPQRLRSTSGFPKRAGVLAAALFLTLLLRSACRRRVHPLPAHRCLQRLLSHRSPGLWRRPRCSAAAGKRRGRPRLGRSAEFPLRIRRRPGASRPAVHLCRLSWARPSGPQPIPSRSPPLH